MTHYYPIRKHKDVSVQTEFNHIYNVISTLLKDVKKIQSGQASFSNSGTIVEIEPQKDTSYAVTITPLQNGSGSFSVTRFQDYFVVSSNIQGDFIWTIISEF